MADPLVVAKVVTELGDEYSFEVSDGMIPRWVRVFVDISDQALEGACSWWLSNDKPFRPRSGELRVKAIELTKLALGEGQSSPAEAFADLTWAIDRIGPHCQYRHGKCVREGGEWPEFDNPLVARAAQIVFPSWVRWCSCTETEWPFVRKDFIAVYQRFQERESQENEMLPEIQEMLSIIAGTERRKQLKAGAC